MFTPDHVLGAVTLLGTTYLALRHPAPPYKPVGLGHLRWSAEWLWLQFGALMATLWLLWDAHELHWGPVIEANEEAALAAVNEVVQLVEEVL